MLRTNKEFNKLTSEARSTWYYLACNKDFFKYIKLRPLKNFGVKIYDTGK